MIMPPPMRKESCYSKKFHFIWQRNSFDALFNAWQW